MKHFLIFLASVFIVLFVLVINKNDSAQKPMSKPILRIFGYSSFTGKYGPGPTLKTEFEKTCQCIVEFIEGSDSGILLQKLKLEGASLGADVVIGLDQYDLQKALVEVKWRQMSFPHLEIDPVIQEDMKPLLSNNYFVPYDWGVLTFVARKNEIKHLPAKLDDLMSPELTKKISLQDPRYSSPGLQFLFWIIRSKGEEEGFKFLKQLMDQAHSFAPSWSTAYGLFQKKQSLMAFSYITSPIYHVVEEKNEDYTALSFQEPLPVQYEFLGIPEMCKQCELAEGFLNLMLSLEGQKIIMQKNYMMPILSAAKVGTPFESIVLPPIMKLSIPSYNEIEKYLKRWADLRRSGSL